VAGAESATASLAPDAGLLARLRQHVRIPLYGNVYALTLNAVVSTMLGGAYWVLAARLYSPADLGVGAAAISTMTFLSNLSQLNLNAALGRFLPRSGVSGGRLIAYAYGASSLVALAVSATFVVVAPAISERLAFLAASPFVALLFCMSVVAWGIFTLQDSILTALRGAIWVPIENASFGLAKILLVIGLAGSLSGLGVFLSWNLPVIIALVPVNVLIVRLLLPRLRSMRESGLPDWRILRRFIAVDYIGYLFMQAGSNALPLLVTARLGATANGRFYVAYSIASSLELVANNFGISLTVEGARDEARLAVYARQILRRALVLFTPVVLLLCLSAPLILAIFGPEYAESGVSLLRLLLLAVLPRLISIIFVAISRVQRRVGRIVVVQALTSTLVLSLSVLAMDRLNILGVGVAYLIGQTAVALLLLPSLIRFLRAAKR
jgi:O-antigen/teichoic acid export membrane protein